MQAIVKYQPGDGYIGLRDVPEKVIFEPQRE